jgi:transcriptional regulator with PAS, ATPase and Fis domain
MLERAIDLPTTILIVGESGTGKDRLARALHDASNRRDRPFVQVEAANLSDDLFESELFGHERGAFTGAVTGKRGLLEVAADGTVYLDEVSSLSLAGQAKFLRVLQERAFRRLGGVVVHPFRARLIVSSRRDLSILVREKAFRDDFFYRIDVVSVRLPRLADRPEDVLPLARGCLKQSALAYGRPPSHFSREAEELLVRHPWPGNVRELFHVVEKAALTAESPVISATDLPFGAFGSADSLLAAAVERRWTPTSTKRCAARGATGPSLPGGSASRGSSSGNDREIAQRDCARGSPNHRADRGNMRPRRGVFSVPVRRMGPVIRITAGIGYDRGFKKPSQRPRAG